MNIPRIAHIMAAPNTAMQQAHLKRMLDGFCQFEDVR
jgi:hypothetical protein